MATAGAGYATIRAVPTPLARSWRECATLRVMTGDREVDRDLDGLVELMGEAASAYIRGEMRRYFDLMNHADDFTLMGPFGGDTTRRSDVTEERLAELEDLFRGGEA